MPETQDTPVFPVVFDDAAILSAIGSSPEAIRRSLRLYRQAGLDEPSHMTIYQWISRKRIAERWRPRLLYCALRSGKLTMAQALRFQRQEEPA